MARASKRTPRGLGDLGDYSVAIQALGMSQDRANRITQMTRTKLPTYLATGKFLIDGKMKTSGNPVRDSAAIANGISSDLNATKNLLASTIGSGSELFASLAAYSKVTGEALASFASAGAIILDGPTWDNLRAFGDNMTYGAVNAGAGAYGIKGAGQIMQGAIDKYLPSNTVAGKVVRDILLIPSAPQIMAAIVGHYVYEDFGSIGILIMGGAGLVASALLGAAASAATLSAIAAITGTTVAGLAGTIGVVGVTLISSMAVTGIGLVAAAAVGGLLLAGHALWCTMFGCANAAADEAAVARRRADHVLLLSDYYCQFYPDRCTGQAGVTPSQDDLINWFFSVVTAYGKDVGVGDLAGFQRSLVDVFNNKSPSEFEQITRPLFQWAINKRDAMIADACAYAAAQTTLLHYLGQSRVVVSVPAGLIAVTGAALATMILLR